MDLAYVGHQGFTLGVDVLLDVLLDKLFAPSKRVFYGIDFVEHARVRLSAVALLADYILARLAVLYQRLVVGCA